MSSPLSPSRDALQKLAEFDSSEIADAIETFGLRLRNQGFADCSLQCRFPHFPPLVGHAVTLQIRSSSPPITGGHIVEHTDWWKTFEAVPLPRVLVIEDVDRYPGSGAFVGRMHGHIFKALGVAGVITNGSVRALPTLETMGLHVFSASVSVSHAYTHIVSVGTTARVGGLDVQPGDLLHGDRHGIVQIPSALLEQIPPEIQRRREKEEEVIRICDTPNVSLSALKTAIEEAALLSGLKTASR